MPPGLTGHLSRRATGFAVTVLCLLLATRICTVLASGAPGQVPFTVALFVLPLMYAVPGSRRLLARYRWLVLPVQAVLTWVPFAVFGGSWQQGIGGLLAGLVLLMIGGRVSWLLAGLLLAAEVIVRATLTGLPSATAWIGVVSVVVYYVDDALVFFGMVRLAQIVGAVEDATGQAEELAVARERLRAAEALQAAIGRRLAGIAAEITATRRALHRDPAAARAGVATAGVTARDAVAQARAVTADRRSSSAPERSELGPTGSVIGARLAWTVLVTVLLMFSLGNSAWIVGLGYSTRLTALAIGGIALVAALQLYHSGAIRQDRRPRAWPVTLAVQTALVYAFLLPSVWTYIGALGPFPAGSILMLVRSRWRWAGYAAMVASYAALFATLPLRSLAPAGPHDPDALLYAALVAVNTAAVGLLVYGLSWLAGLARRREGLQDQLARMAAVRERLRVARDVHDLLGLGLSAVALKADLVGALIGRDEGRAAAELTEMARICAAARADIRLVTGDGQRLSLAGELDAAQQILASVGIGVRAFVAAGPLLTAGDEVLAPVLREAVTNILRHSAATACEIEMTAGRGALRLRVANDGVTEPPTAAQPPGAGGGRGLANMTARVRAAGGRLACRRAAGRFELTAQIPMPSGLAVLDQLAPARAAMIATVVRRTVMLASRATPTASRTSARRPGGSGVRAPDVASWSSHSSRV